MKTEDKKDTEKDIKKDSSENLGKTTSVVFLKGSFLDGQAIGRGQEKSLDSALAKRLKKAKIVKVIN